MLDETTRAELRQLDARADERQREVMRALLSAMNQRQALAYLVQTDRLRTACALLDQNMSFSDAAQALQQRFGCSRSTAWRDVGSAAAVSPVRAR